MKHSVDVANDVVNLLQYTPYVAQIILNPEGTYVKAGDTKKKAAVLVNIDLHRSAKNNWLQDKWLAVKLTTRLVLNLIKK